MFISFLILIIVAIVGISITELANTYEFLAVAIPYCNYALYGAIGLFVLFVIISIVKEIKK